MQAQIGRVGDADDEIRHRFAGIAAGDDVARDRLVRARRRERVGAGQIEHAHTAPGRRGVVPFLALDRDAGVVRDLLPRAGEQVEQRGLAAVRIADESNL